MKRKVVTLLLTAAMIATSLSGCGKATGSTQTPGTSEKAEGSTQEGTQAGSSDEGKTAEELLMEPYPEPVKIKVVLGYRESENPNTPDNVTPETSTAVKKLKEDLNIELEYSWIVNNDQYNEKFGAELAAGNLPDVFMLNPTEFEDIAGQGGLADLTEVYEKYRCADIDNIINHDGKILDAARKDGQLLGLTNSVDSAQQTSQMYYNMTLLKAVGIESADQLPKTIEEFEALCDKLMTVDYDGDGKTGGPVLPACKNFSDAQLADFQPFFHAYETWCAGWKDENGSLVYAGVDEKLKEPLTKLNEWYNKGYFAKDFAAYDIWAADSPVVADIVNNKFAIVPGSWWISNWPLNTNMQNYPDANWVAGPNLSVDGKQPAVMVDRYPISTFTVVGRDCKNPEAVLKMIYWSSQYEALIRNPEYKKNMTPEQQLEADSYVYTWMPYRVHSPISFRMNFDYISKAVKEGKTDLSNEEVPKNNEFWSSWSALQQYNETPGDAAAWGTYYSRIAPDGGVANMIKTIETATVLYDEVYVTTPSMVMKDGELVKYRDNTFLSMIMGETPIANFDKYVSEWKAQGGADIEKEVNEWYKTK